MVGDLVDEEGEVVVRCLVNVLVIKLYECISIGQAQRIDVQNIPHRET